MTIVSYSRFVGAALVVAGLLGCSGANPTAAPKTSAESVKDAKPKSMGGPGDKGSKPATAIE